MSCPGAVVSGCPARRRMPRQDRAYALAGNNEATRRRRTDAATAPRAEFIREPSRSYPDLLGLGCGVAPALGFAADPPVAACCALSSAALTLARSAWYVARSPFFSAAWAWL